MCVYCEIPASLIENFYTEHPELDKNGDIVRLQIHIIGDAGCGKSSLIDAYETENFPSVTSVSQYARYKLMKVNKKPAHIIFYDMIGIENFSDPRTRSLMLMFSEVIIVCYSVSSRESFANISTQWFPELTASQTNKPVLLVGLKKDLRRVEHKQCSNIDSEFVTFKEGKVLASSIGAVGFIECSSLTREGVKDVFEMAVKKALNESEMNEQFWRCLCCFS